MCDDCNLQPHYPGLPGRRHVECVPYCGSCYYKSFARHRPGYKRPCKCSSTDRMKEYQFCCRKCIAKPQAELQSARHRRYEKECRDIAYKKGSKCGLCKKELKHWARWWKCGRCAGECRDKIHPGFVRGRKVKEKDVETGDAGGGEH